MATQSHVRPEDENLYKEQEIFSEILDSMQMQTSVNNSIGSPNSNELSPNSSNERQNIVESNQQAYQNFKKKMFAELSKKNLSMKEIMQIISEEWQKSKSPSIGSTKSNSSKRNKRTSLTDYSTNSMSSNQIHINRTQNYSPLNGYIHAKSNCESTTSNNSINFCHICDQHFKSDYHYKEHLKGKSHLKRENKFNSLNNNYDCNSIQSHSINSPVSTASDFMQNRQGLQKNTNNIQTRVQNSCNSKIDSILVNFSDKEMSKSKNASINSHNISSKNSKNSSNFSGSCMNIDTSIHELAVNVNNIVEEKEQELNNINRQIFLLKSSDSYKQIMKQKESINDLSSLVQAFTSLKLRYRKMDIVEPNKFDDNSSFMYKIPEICPKMKQTEYFTSSQLFDNTQKISVPDLNNQNSTNNHLELRENGNFYLNKCPKVQDRNIYDSSINKYTTQPNNSINGLVKPLVNRKNNIILPKEDYNYYDYNFSNNSK